MTRSAPAPAKMPDRRPDPTGWRHDLFLAALAGALSLTVFDALFDRMERSS